MPFQLLLTASIKPNGSFVKLVDIEARRQQYLRAFTAALSIRDPIVGGVTFVENTGADLSDFEQLIAQRNCYGKTAEVISLQLNDFPVEYGIGYGEFRLLDEGIAQSKAIKAGEQFVKLTGRLRVRNLTAILRRIPSTADLAADIVPYKSACDGFVDTRLMVVSHQFYVARIAGMYKQVDGSKNITAEHCLYQVVRNSPGTNILPSLPLEPRWSGYSGSTGMQYDSPWMRLRYPARVARRFAKQILNQPDLRKVWNSTRVMA
jgi:hypothetical protein